MNAFINESTKKQKKTNTKRVIIGPGQIKKKTEQKLEDEIPNIDLLGTSDKKTEEAEQNLIAFDKLQIEPNIASKTSLL